MSKLTILTASVFLFFTGLATAQDVKDVKDPPVGRTVDAGKVAAKPTAALRHLAAAEAAIKADESLNKRQKTRALRSLNGVRRALGVKVKGQGNARKKKRDGATEGDGDAGGEKKKRRRGRNKNGAGAGDGDAGAGEKKRGGKRKKKNKKNDAGDTGK